MGTEHSVTTGRFQEAKSHWPLSGVESWKVTVASVPVAAIKIAWMTVSYAAGAVTGDAVGMRFERRFTESTCRSIGLHLIQLAGRTRPEDRPVKERHLRPSCRPPIPAQKTFVNASIFD
ncbi:hypothetical protein [Sulfuritalea hydrogenivorans]|uniref:Uncharacterized protein n=1 Tax=Sulfuritalea hydrogenivorans sk43H TaxID=1223802 RepID=W0SF11_9PROT|nr:hypothetical protein [Sulfuritalea hydrogenivorans]BAO29557.1 hypothetical protein SUTH_01765 [Sulfuritalea hydrogenivorans sk43H]